MITNTHRTRFEDALRSPNPGAALHSLAVELKREGMDQLSMYHLFTEYLVLGGDDQRQDAITDTLEIIWGGAWAKGRSLFDHELTNEEVRRPLP